MRIPGAETRVVELRVHGILGTTGDALTGSVASVDVAGDGVGRIVRPADRLRRPVAGPPLSAGERTVPRVVEGYIWEGMTSGGWAKATWALLFPFALANMAHWMLPPSRPGSTTARVLTGASRALLRIAALLLTMLFVAQLTVVSLDLIAAQCMGPGAPCMTFLPEGFRQLDIARSVLGLFPVALVVFLMHRLSTVSWRVSTSNTGRSSERSNLAPGANVIADPDAPGSRATHVLAALSTMALLTLGGPLSGGLNQGVVDPRWIAAVAGIGLALLGTATMDVPANSPTGLRRFLANSTLGPIPRRVLMSFGALLLTTVALAPPRLAGPLPGSGATIDVLTVALLATCLALAVLLVPAALLSRSAWAGLPRRLRPWAGGWMAAPVLFIAVLLGAGFGAGLALSARQALANPQSRLPAAYDDVAMFWGVATVLLLITATALLPVLVYARWKGAHSDKAVPAEVALLHAGRQQDQRRAAAAWRWADLRRRFSHHMLLVGAVVLAVAAISSLASRVTDIAEPNWSRWLVGLGVVALAALAAGLLRLVYLAATERQTARYLGVLCDLALFWPREAHPVVPPCYALKVLPELVARATEHLAEPDTRVVLVGTSQGSLLATVATARLLDSLPEQDRERVGLVTAGSELQWAYPRAFPDVVPHESLRRLSGGLNGRWRSLCRGTDPIGGGVTTWNRQVYDGMLIGVGFRGDGTEGPLPAASRGPTGALVLGGDHWLPDPQRGPFSSRRWVPGVLGHTEYSGDPEWDRAVAMAAGLEIPVRGAALPLRTPTTTTLPQVPEPGESLPAQGGDGGSINDLASKGTSAPAESESDLLADSDHHDEPSAEIDDPPDAQDAPSPRLELTTLPEISEPQGRPAPWERGSALRSSER